MSLSNKQWEFLKDVAKLIVYADKQGYKLTGGELWRTDEQQEIYYETGKSQVIRSQQQDRLAMDFNLFVDGQIQWSKNIHWIKLGTFWKTLNEKNRWGGNFNTLRDPYHFERVV